MDGARQTAEQAGEHGRQERRMSRNDKTLEKPREKITRADIESKLRELRGEVDERVEDAKVPTIAIAVGVAVVTIVAAYWFGKRKGRKRQMVLEIKRI